MAVRGLVVVSALIGSAAGLGYLLSSENPEQRSVAVEQSREAAPSPDARPGTPAPAASSGPSSPEPPPDDALAFMLTQVSEQYQETSRYPSYSVPLSESQAKAYRGNVYDPITLPLSDGGSFSVSLEKFRFTQGEEILVAASLSGPEVVERTMDVSLESTQDQTEEAETTLDYEADGFYEGTLESDVPPGEYRLVVEATVDSRPLRHVSTLTIEPDLGEFVGIGTPRVSGNDLVIPVEFDASESGYYALSAQLYADGQPVAHLSGEQALDGTGDQIELRAHGSVLADLAHSGNVDQLQLKGLQIRRLPAQPGDRTDYAFGPEEGFTFTPPDLDSLRNTRAGDPESEQRAALLQKLTAGF
ncbi:hypothetical protein [Marinobacter sp.]|uniref:hypothetical protein n=1 Tax=Marinobacter sp. TaxID=50741 RepID=UPI0038509B31